MSGKPSRWFMPLAATAAILLAAPSAGAAVSRPPELQAFTFPGVEGACDFPVTITGTGGKIHLAELKNGSIITAGKGVVLTYTNDLTGKSYTVKTAGSVARYVQNPDGVTATFTGHAGFVYFSSDEGGPGITQYTGRLVLTLDSLKTFNVESVDATSGQAVDVCAAIS